MKKVWNSIDRRYLYIIFSGVHYLSYYNNQCKIRWFMKTLFCVLKKEYIDRTIMINGYYVKRVSLFKICTCMLSLCSHYLLIFISHHWFQKNISHGGRFPASVDTAKGVMSLLTDHWIEIVLYWLFERLGYKCKFF